jgi:hypothetical protein
VGLGAASPAVDPDNQGRVSSKVYAAGEFKAMMVNRLFPPAFKLKPQWALLGSAGLMSVMVLGMSPKAQAIPLVPAQGGGVNLGFVATGNNATFQMAVLPAEELFDPPVVLGLGALVMISLVQRRQLNRAKQSD